LGDPSRDPFKILHDFDAAGIVQRGDNRKEVGLCRRRVCERLGAEFELDRLKGLQFGIRQLFEVPMTWAFFEGDGGQARALIGDGGAGSVKAHIHRLRPVPVDRLQKRKPSPSKARGPSARASRSAAAACASASAKVRLFLTPCWRPPRRSPGAEPRIAILC